MYEVSYQVRFLIIKYCLGLWRRVALIKTFDCNVSAKELADPFIVHLNQIFYNPFEGGCAWNINWCKSSMFDTDTSDGTPSRPGMSYLTAKDEDTLFIITAIDHGDFRQSTIRKEE